MATSSLQDAQSLQNILIRSYKSTNIVQDALLQAQQQQLLISISKQFNQKLTNLDKSYTKEGPSRQSTQNSIIISRTFTEINENNSSNKFQSQLEETIHQYALLEVKQKCSNETYNLFQKLINAPKNTNIHTLKKNLERYKKKVENLCCENKTLIKEKTNALWQLNNVKPKLDAIEKQKAKIKKNLQQIVQKQRHLLAIQTSLALKEKTINERQKKYERERNSGFEIKSMIQKANQQLWLIWDQIKDKCWYKCQEDQIQKRAIIQKLKQRLLWVRNNLKVEQQYIESQFQRITNLSEQFNKLVRKSQQLLTIDNNLEKNTDINEQLQK